MTKFSLACLGIVAIAVGCKTSNASSNMSGSDMSADGGMSMDGGGSGSMSMDGGSGSMSMDGGMSSMSGSMNSAAGSMQSGMNNGMNSMADAGSSAMNSAQTGMNNGMNSATTAADQARSSAGSMGSSAADAGMSAMGSMGSMGGSDAGSSSSSSGSASGSGSSNMSDAQIAGITAAAHKSEIDAGKLAKKQSKNAKVKTFANMMVKQHTNAQKMETDLASKAGITPADSDTSSQLQQSGSDNLTKLQGLKGKDFDTAYVQSQVDAHQKVLDTLDNQLIPAAQNADLKAQLQKERGVVAMHLDHAKKLQDSMGGSQ